MVYGWVDPFTHTHTHTHTHVSIHAVLSLVRFPTRVYASRGCKYERAAFESISAWCQMDDVVSVVCRVAYRLKRTELVRKTARRRPKVSISSVVIFLILSEARRSTVHSVGLSRA
jgi:hypothetical protein